MGLALKKGELYTYSDYLEWDTDDRYELVDGVPYLMSPAPLTAHQAIVIELSWRIRNFLEGKPCKVFTSPIDVRLNADEEDNTVVQPDVLVVCDKTKIGKRAIKGAPDLVVEVLSPSTKRYDIGMKLDKYLAAGVRECWILNPESGILRVYARNAVGKDEMKVYQRGDKVSAGILPGLEIDLGAVLAAVEF
jgi:Uma2 family endonuclease